MAAAIIICLLVGGLCGMINGFLIVKYQLSAVIVTLSTMILYRGLAYVILEDQSAGDFPSWFSYFGWGYVGKIPFILRSEEHTSELQSRFDLVCRLLLEKK